MRTILCLFVSATIMLASLEAHDVVWKENPIGFQPNNPMQLLYPGASESIQVKPVTGELCTVSVNLDPLNSTLISAEIIAPNPAQEVAIRVSALRQPIGGTETTTIHGSWQATGLPVGQDCTAVFPNLFSVTVQVTASAPQFVSIKRNADDMIAINWTGGDGPFTLQKKASLTEPVWMDVLTTFTHSLDLPTTGEDACFFRLQLPTIPLDMTDYDRDRPAVAQFYLNDPQSYWVHHGIPPLARLSNLLAAGGKDPTNAFAGFMVAFDQTKFSAALTNGQLPIAFSNRVDSFAKAGQPPAKAVVNSLRSFVDELDTVVQQQGTNAAGAGQIYGMFNDVVPQVFQTNSFVAIGPKPIKQFTQPRTNHIAWVDVHGTDAFAMQKPPTVAATGDTDTSTRTNWANITFPNWNTTYNGVCGALATGASLAKLDPGAFPPSVTCQFWNEFSRDLGAQTNGTPASTDEIAAYYGRLGYGCIEAWNGPFETAVEEADKALKRGCDVSLLYISADGKKSHIEMVEQIVVDPNNSQKAVVHTLSWGQHESVNYGNGKFSGKSDVQRYGAGTWLGTPGEAIFTYYCNK